jgi:hypothetical protein
MEVRERHPTLPFMNWTRKRIRGLRRHFRHLQQRATRPSKLRLVDLTWLARFQQTFLTVTADPWASCQEVPRYQAFRALWVQRLLHTFPHWRAHLKRRYPTFYLAIQLHEPTPSQFCQSRLVAAVNERRWLYENAYGVAQDIPLPTEYATIPGIEALEWRTYIKWSSPYSLEEFAQAGTWLANIPHKGGVTNQGEPCIFVQLGLVWVGQVPNL